MRIGSQIADGLAAAHKQGLVHRDIKPANILLENGIERVKITDFGLARSVDDAHITRTGEVSGTPQYMSPEQALGQHVDHRSDLFSLGCVLYAMCAGRPPFRGDNVAVVVRRICDDTPRPISEINPEIPGWLILTIERLLAKDPAQRFQSAAEVADVLSGQLAHAQQPQRGHIPSLPDTVQRLALVERLAHFVHVSTGPEKPVSNWLLVPAFAVCGFLLGRVVPGNGLLARLILTLFALGCSVLLYKRGVAAGWHKLRIARWVVAGAVTALWAFAIGAETVHFAGSEIFRFGDFLIFGLGIGYLVYVFVVRRGIVHPTGTVTGTAEPPVVQPTMTPAEQAQATAARPWKMAGWLTVTLLSLALLIPCGLAVGVLIPVIIAYRQSESALGNLTIEFDNNKAPVQEIRVRGGNLPGERVFPVRSMPFRIRLAPGHYTLTGTMTVYEDSGQRMARVQPVTFSILNQKETRLNLGSSGVE